MKKAALRIIAIILLVFSVSTCQYALKGSVAEAEETRSGDGAQVVGSTHSTDEAG
jgi:hypothetical protein